MTPIVQRLVASALTREDVAQHVPDRLQDMRAYGDAWRACAASAGVPCPQALFELGEAMADHLISIHVDDHGWELLTPDDAMARARSLRSLAAQFPALAARTEMLPIFGEDGDLLLLATDGVIHRFTHDGWETDGVVARSLEELLAKNEQS